MDGGGTRKGVCTVQGVGRGSCPGAGIWHTGAEQRPATPPGPRRTQDGNGEISVQELRTTMHELGDLLSEEEIVSFMLVMDVNNDGVIGVRGPGCG
jgi:hypothetical protein